MIYRQTLTAEKEMSSLKKSDCISVPDALTQVGISRNTLNAYLIHLGIEKHKFPFDNRTYITLEDFERLKQFVEENRG